MKKSNAVAVGTGSIPKLSAPFFCILSRVVGICWLTNGKQIF
ncbi:hypothetical protein [Epilithonimonas vandammei]|nr:hypothetical protein [Epilithonimonas vandammei]